MLPVEIILVESPCSSLELRLYLSVVNDDEETAVSLLNQGADVHTKVTSSLTCIHIAVEKGLLNIIKHLLRHGADVNSRYPVAENKYTGSTLLYRAAAKGNEAIVSLLLEYSADVKAENKDGSTALHIAAEKGYLNIVKMLLEKGAKINFEIVEDPFIDESFYKEQFLESKILRNELNLDVVDVYNISNFDGVYSPVHLAIKGKHDNILKLLLESGAEIDATDSFGDTVLSIAVHAGCLETVEYVLNCSPSLNNSGNKRGLGYAVKFQDELHRSIVQKLLHYGFAYNSDPMDFEDMFLEIAIGNGHNGVIYKTIEKIEDFHESFAEYLINIAIDSGNEDVIKFLIKQEVSVNGPVELCLFKLKDLNLFKLLLSKGIHIDDASETLIMAIEERMYELIEILLNNKTSVNGTMSHNSFLTEYFRHLPTYKKEFKYACNISPLFVAAALGDQFLVELFLENGADINFKTENDLTPLLISVIGGHLEVVEILLKSGADIESIDSDERTPLYLAGEFGRENVVKLLLRRGAKIDARAPLSTARSAQLTPFLVAAKNGHLNVVKTIVDFDTRKSVINSTDNEGNITKTALNYASENGHSSVTKFLLDHGSKVNLIDWEGVTPLFAAARNGHSQTVEILLEYGANVRSFDVGQSETPLTNAVKKNHVEVVTLLLKYGAKPDLTQISDMNSPLIISAGNGNLKIVDVLIKYGADINYFTPSGETALSAALKNGRTEVVKLLLANGANFSCKKQRSLSLLRSVEKGHINSIEFLLNDSADINFTGCDGQTALHQAVRSNRLDVVHTLLKSGANVNAKDAQMRGPLNLSAEEGNLEIIEILLKSGADIEATDNLGRTAVFVSAEIGHANVVSFLMENGADVNHKAKNLKTPLIISAEKGHCEIIRMLVKGGGHINSIDDKRRSALYFAAASGLADEVNLLLEFGAEIDSAAENGKTPLIISAERSHFETVETLVRRGANVNASDNDRHTALYFVAEYGHIKTLTLLTENKATVETSTYNGKTPLIISSERGHLNCVTLLLKLKANVHSTDHKGLTAVHYAAEFGYHDITKLLLEQCAIINCESRNDVSLLLICAEKKFINICDTLMKLGARFDLTARTDLVDHLATTLHKWDVKVFTRALNYFSADDKFLNETSLRSLFDIVNNLDLIGHTMTDEEASNYESIAEILVKFSIKMKTVNVLNDENLVAVRYCDETVISSFEVECDAEARNMKCDIVGDSNISVYDILNRDLNGLASINRNDHFSKFLHSSDFNSKYPLYRNLIYDQFNKGRIRRQLIDECVEVCQCSLALFVPLPGNIIESILHYLSNADLRSLKMSGHHSCSGQ